MKNFVVICFLSAALVACSDYSQELKSQFVDQCVLVNTDSPSTSVDENDIHAVVQKMFGESESRSTDYSISVIKDEDGVPSIYVVNYDNNERFVLLSASKTYVPILAYSEDGNFSGDPLHLTGFSDWKENMLLQIKQSKSLPEDSTFVARRLWNYYTHSKDLSFLQTNKSRSEISSDEFIRLTQILQDSCASWTAKGYIIHNVSDQFYDDESKCEEVRQELENATYPLYADDWESLSVVVERIENYNVEVPNLLMTTWNGSTFDFRSAFPLLTSGEYAGESAFVGCGPIAVGQIIRDYCYPLTYDWNQMPFQYGTPETSRFLYDIAELADANYVADGTSTTIEGLRNAFLGMGYSAQINYSLNWNNVKSNITNGRPVLMAGVATPRGHAWVACGYKKTGSRSVMEYYCFTNPNSLELQNWELLYDYTNEYYYYNWGNSGTNDGFFQGVPNYTNLMSIVNISPNN